MQKRVASQTLLCAYPFFPGRTVHVLDGIWDFAWLGEVVALDTLDIGAIKFNDRMAVPGVFDAVGDYAGKRGSAAYRKIVNVTPGTTGRLHFHGLGLWARVYVDKKAIGEWALPYSEYYLDVPASEKAEREIIILIDNRYNNERVPLAHQFYDFYFFGGIYRSVEWHETKAWYFDRVQIRTLNPAKGEVQATALLRGKAPATVSLEYSFDNEPLRKIESVPVKEGKITLDLTVPDPTPWSPASPNLHTLRLETEEDGITERFGLRTVRAEGDKILLNGKPVKLLGYCRHETHLQFGPALPLAQIIQDLQLLRDLGCNFVRGSHYPQDSRFLDLCDELGFLVFEESLGWGNRVPHFSDAKFCDHQELQTRLMVRKSVNHPCVIMWGFLNEGASNDASCSHLYKRLAKCIREEDLSRLVTYASMFPFADLNYEIADVISVNQYPGWYAADKERVRPLEEIVPHCQKIAAHMDSNPATRKPLIMSEIGAGAIYGWRDVLKSHWSEEYQADYLEIVCREMVLSPRYAGVALWQFCDGRTYASSHALGRPRCINDKGTLDEYRRPKLAYEKVKACFKGAR